MRKYNYFDDEPEESGFFSKFFDIFDKLDFRDSFASFGRKTKDTVEDIFSGGTVNRLKELPNLRALSLKLLAFLLAVIAVILFIFIFSHSINSQNKNNKQFCADASKVCSDYISNYGAVKWEMLDREKFGKNTAKLTGLCYARQMDFNNDGSDELMVCFNNKNIYYLEVWGYDGKKFVKFYSDEASRTEKDADGSWIGFYRKNNKYYICKSEPKTPEKVELYGLRGDKFKKYSSCEYDYKDNIYSVKGKINASDFETIKLSVIKASKAEQITEIVSGNLDSFGSISVAAIESKKTDAQLKAEAYYEIIERRNTKYGKARVVSKNNKTYIDGVCLARLIDFNCDGNEELFLVYRKQIRKSSTNAYSGEFIIVEEPVYCMEVYNWNGAVAKKIFNKDGISNYLNNDAVNLVILNKDGKKTRICNNTYSFVTQFTYTAASRIYKMKGEGFDSVFNVRMENDYGYREYYIDNEYVYHSEFEANAYKVPMYLNDGGSYDKNKFEVIYFSGEDTDSYNATINETVKTIQSLNSDYTPEDL